MDMKKQLMELIDNMPPHEGKSFEEALAEHLIANGVAMLPHLMMIDGIVKELGPYKTEEVVLFNNNHISAEESLHIVRAGEYHPSVLTLPKPQFVSLFLNSKEG